MPYKDKEKNRKYQREWARRNKDKRREYHRELRLRAISKLGGECKYCGCDEIEALEFNHINGGGYAERKGGTRGKQFLLDIIGDRREDIELTCRICNSLHYLKEIKGITGNWSITWNS